MIRRIIAYLAAGFIIQSCLLPPGFAGFARGAGTDSPAVQSEAAPTWTLAGIKPGARIEVTLRNQARPLQGKYEGTETLPEDAYAAKYAKAREAWPLDIKVPALGDPVSMDDFRGQTYSGSFQGIDKGVLLLKLDGSDQISRVNLEMVKSVRTAGGVAADMDRLKPMVDSGSIPFRSALILDTKTGRRLTPTDEIVDLQIRGKYTSTLVVAGILAGLLIAGAILYSINWRSNWNSFDMTWW
jgi:hypothetical protein